MRLMLWSADEETGIPADNVVSRKLYDFNLLNFLVYIYIRTAVNLNKYESIINQVIPST